MTWALERKIWKALTAILFKIVLPAKSDAVRRSLTAGDEGSHFTFKQRRRK